ncbi:MAG: nucleotidyl transferase AbiEii/AbiGii toxin family protein [Phycisphaerae bacterium]
MSGLDGVILAAAEVEAFCRDHGWQFCFIGGVAVQRWGMPRFTQDVDLTLMATWGTEATFIDILLEKFSARLSNARNFALEHRVLLAKTATGIDLDIALGAFPFEEASTGRATLWPVNDQITLTTCSAEDLIIHKVFAGRDRDWSDVDSVLVRQRGKLNLAHIQHELPPLLELKDDAESFEKLQRLITDADSRSQ